MHTLALDGHDIACAQRWQRLAMHMADFAANTQRLMAIRSGQPRYPVRELR